ncbi:MAG: hypothetical protein HZA50_00800 [Planctomycetes bacterium]|nr:hypothetical protein [Planctomycetota bacterium]
MTETETGKGTGRALAGAGLQAVLATACLGVWLAAGGKSALACTLLLACGVLVWLMSALIFYCRRLAQIEQIELAALAEASAKGTVFEGLAQDKPAAARLAFVRRWVSPIFTLLWAACHAMIGLLLIGSFGKSAEPPLHDSALWGLVLLATAFGGFLYSRICTGLAGQPQWLLLRSAASYMLVSVISLLLVCLAMFFWIYSLVDYVLAYMLACVQVVLAAELLMNLILDIYRPRMPGREDRPSFDSRLFNLLAEPERVGHSIAETLNYQFGFEVSKTWFYQLCSKAVAPLIVLGILLLFLISSLVIVDAGQMATVCHLGKLDRDGGGKVRLLDPGLHLKWPWPIDTVSHFPVEQAQSLYLGTGDDRKKEAEIINGKSLVLWHKEHGAHEEINFLLAVPAEADRGDLSASRPADGQSGVPQTQPGRNKPPPFNIIKLVMLVQYDINDVQAYSRSSADPRKFLELAANREMIRYCASATLDRPQEGAPPDRPQAILTSGQTEAAKTLKRRIQTIADELGLGVRITFVGVLEAHPPADAVSAFAEITSIERTQEIKRYLAQGDANRALANVMGDPARALELALDIRMLEEFGSLADLKAQPGNLALKLDEEIAKVRRNIATLDRDIKRDVQMGLSAAGGGDKQRLREKYQGYLDTLLKIHSGVPASHDYSAEIAQAAAAVNQAMRLEALTGEPAVILAQAVAYRWNKDLNERTLYELYSLQLDAYLAGRELYKLDRVMEVLEEVLPKITKYVLGVDRDKLQLWLNLEETTSALEAVEPAPSK